MIKHCLGNSQINSIPAQRKEFSYITFLYKINEKVYAYNQSSRYYKSKNFSTLKTHLSINQEHKSTQKSPGSLFPAIAVKNPQEKLAILNISSRNVTTSTRETTTRAWIYDVRMAQFVLKMEKLLSHIMGPRASQDLRGAFYFVKDSGNFGRN